MSDSEWQDEGGTEEEIWGKEKERKRKKPNGEIEESQWEFVDAIRLCERAGREELSEKCGNPEYANESNSILVHFLAFFPTADFFAELPEMQAAYDKRWYGPNSGKGSYRVIFDRGNFLRFLGILLRMAVYSLPLASYWQSSVDTEEPEFFIGRYMKFQAFKRFWACLRLPN